jgi:diguanylate cyclase (GGDEF)-like protein
MSIAGETLAKVLFWRRFAAIGFGSFFTFMLHFFIFFTGYDSKIKNKKRFYTLLYLPAFIVLLGFTYFPQLNPAQYNMIQTPMGWINIAANNIWDMFFIVYYVTYFSASILLLWRWGRQSSNPKDKRTSNILIISFITNVIVGSLIDIFGNLVFSVDLPQLAPILTVFPSIVIYYFIRRHGLLSPEQVNEDALLMSEQIRVKLSVYISASFLFAGMVSFISGFFFTDDYDILNLLLISGIFEFFAVLVQLIQRIIKNKAIKDIILAVMFSVTVPIFIFLNFDKVGASIWAFPFTLLILSILYDKNFIRIMLSVSIILTQIVLWALNPEAIVTIDNSNHIIRLAIFLTGIWFANLGSRIFQTKLNENAEQIGFQKITTEISTEFISINEQNLRSKFDNALSKLGTFLNPDRIYIYIFDESSGKDKLTCFGIWNNENVIDNKDLIKEITESEYPRFVKRIQVGNIITLSNIFNFESATGDELPKLLGSKDKAFVAIPIILKNKVFGFFGVDSQAMTKQWSDTKLGFFRIISSVFSAAFERIQQEREIIELAYYDQLTKLPNRFLFRDRLAQMIYLSERTNNTLAVIFLDIDAFKSINDSVGHDGGDTLLKELAGQLVKTLRKSDTIARFGGDGFMILLPNLPSTHVISKIADKVLHIFDTPFVINEQEFFITASAGISVYPYDGKDADSLIKNADLAMNKAKELGKNRYMFCTEDMKEEVLVKMRLTNNLFRVIDKHELLLYYQPQIDTKTGRIVGAEALLRWSHPEYGLLLPHMFIPLAEQIGLIGSIGDWVLREACRQCKEWHDNGLTKICMSVNVSPLQLQRPDFVRHVQQILDETKLDAKYLELELTESAAESNSENITDILNLLKEMGITISIDDFGTEYSSLSRLSSMPIDRIKLDMRFIHSIDKSDKQNAIIKSIIELSHILGLQVVAEGVETEAQLNFLRKHTCDMIQGFYFYRPLPPDKLGKILLEE